MNDKGSSDNKQVSLYAVLAAHLRSLVAAGADKRLVDEYSALLKFMKSRGATSFDEDVRNADARILKRKKREITDQEIENSSLDQLSEFVADESVGRESLERIAIRRFSVPSGSMRSFSNRRMLVDKLRVLIRNELAHETIGRVARREGTDEH